MLFLPIRQKKMPEMRKEMQCFFGSNLPPTPLRKKIKTKTKTKQTKQTTKQKTKQTKQTKQTSKQIQNTTQKKQQHQIMY